jgi:hypothetical protein
MSSEKASCVENNDIRGKDDDKSFNSKLSICDAVSRVLKGYDWTLVTTTTKPNSSTKLKLHVKVCLLKASKSHFFNPFLNTLLNLHSINKFEKYIELKVI